MAASPADCRWIWPCPGGSRRRRYRAAEFTSARLMSAKGPISVTVSFPTKDCAETIGGVLRDAIDRWPRWGSSMTWSWSTPPPGTAPRRSPLAPAPACFNRTRSAASLGQRWARVTRCGERCRRPGARSSASWTGTRRNRPALRGLLGPLLCDPSVELVKGAFDRPLRGGAVSLPHEGGRVTELMARPLINLHGRCWPASRSRSPASSPPAAPSWRRSRSPWATGSRSRC